MVLIHKLSDFILFKRFLEYLVLVSMNVFEKKKSQKPALSCIALPQQLIFSRKKSQHHGKEKDKNNKDRD